MGPEGLEQSGLKAPKTPISENRGTESGTVKSQQDQHASARQYIAQCLPTLHGKVIEKIVALIKSEGEKQ